MKTATRKVMVTNSNLLFNLNKLNDQILVFQLEGFANLRSGILKKPVLNLSFKVHTRISFWKALSWMTCSKFELTESSSGNLNLFAGFANPFSRDIKRWKVCKFVWMNETGHYDPATGRYDGAIGYLIDGKADTFLRLAN